MVPIIAMTTYALTDRPREILYGRVVDRVAKAVQVKKIQKALTQVAEKMAKRDAQ